MLLAYHKPTFARKFDGTASYLLSTASPLASANPTATVACWFNATNLPGTRAALWGVASGAGTETSNHTSLELTSSGAVTAASEDTRATTTVTTAAGIWTHAAAKWIGNNDRTAYINGGDATRSTGADGTSAQSRMGIGARPFNTPDNFFDGCIALVTVWNAALEDSDIARLAMGVNPIRVKPESIVAHYDWAGTAGIEFGLGAAVPLTNNGSVTVNGPGFLRMRAPRPWSIGFGYSEAAPPDPGDDDIYHRKIVRLIG